MARRRVFGGTLKSSRPLPGKLTAARLWIWILWSQRWYAALAMLVGTMWMGTLAITPVMLGQVVDAGIRDRAGYPHRRLPDYCCPEKWAAAPYETTNSHVSSCADLIF